jgi:hypothetical protein
MLETVFSDVSAPKLYRKDPRPVQLISIAWYSLSAETEEFPLLEAVSRERLLKTQQAENCIAGAVVICKVRTLAVACNYFKFRVVCKWVNISNSPI